VAVIIRAPAGSTDYRAIAKLQMLTSREPVTSEDLLADDMPVVPSAICRRVVAVDAQGQVVGTSKLHHAAWMPQGHYDISLVVAPEYRHQGIGSQLYANAVAHAKASGMTLLVTTLRDDYAPEARSFAERRGFAFRQHWVYWELPLLSFEEAPFLPVFERAQAQHIRFFSFADAGNTLETQHKLYTLNRRTSLDAPGEDSFPTFDEFVQDIVQADWFRPDSQLIAADGDQWVGLVAVGIDGDRAFNAFTGVEQMHRRRGIALALTLLGIRYARQHNATRLEVMNDSRNLPMFKLQEQLGYQRIVGRYIMGREFV
jgi:GNAT superfamily N-acetyltransferase